MAPEAAVGGTIALVRDGDIITLDIPGRRLEVDISQEEMDERRRGLTPPPPAYTTGTLAKVRSVGIVVLGGRCHQLI